MGGAFEDIRARSTAARNLARTGPLPMIRPPGYPAWPEQQLLQQSYALRPGGIFPSAISMPMMPRQWAPKGGQNGG